MKRKKIVTIGGGTGSFMLLSGLKKYPVDISAIVSMADDGGSTGMLRDELGVLPPGDVRQCLVALSESSDVMRKLLNYRFESGGLKGHNFGNLLLSALEKISGNFEEGVGEAIKILNVKGDVIPVSNGDMRLNIRLKNGKIIKGESKLDDNEEIREIGVKEVFLESKIKANKKALKKIKEADLVIIGPGDHYGSIIPNLLVPGISEAIIKSKATVIYNCNLTNKKGQTENFELDDYADAVNSYLGKTRIDYVVYNVKKAPRVDLETYKKKEGIGMTTGFSEGRSKKRKFKVVRADVLKKIRADRDKSDALVDKRSFIRHDSEKLAKVIMMISEIGDYENVIKEII